MSREGKRWEQFMFIDASKKETNKKYILMAEYVLLKHMLRGREFRVLRILEFMQ